MIDLVILDIIILWTCFTILGVEKDEAAEVGMQPKVSFWHFLTAVISIVLTYRISVLFYYLFTL